MADVTSPFGFPYPEDTDLVRDGATDIENLAEGVNDYLAGGYLYEQTVYYTSSGTFVKADYPGLRAIRVRCQGAGASGGVRSFVATNDNGAGGGGGGYAESFITNIAGLDASVTVTRGAGGAAVTRSTEGATNSNAGANSSFGALVIGVGGGATSDNAIIGGPGSGGTGDIVFSGADGASGSSGNTSAAGSGGSSHLGGGGTGGRGAASASSNGVNGTIYGGGGGGSTSHSSTSSKTSGAGANGLIIVDVFI
jgi:hypothetical protein